MNVGHDDTKAWATRVTKITKVLGVFFVNFVCFVAKPRGLRG